MQRKIIWLVMSCLMVLLLLSGCGIPQEDYDAVAAERDATQAQVASLQSELNKAQSQIEVLESDLTAMESDLATAQVPTSVPETAPEVVQEKAKDIESIMGRAEGLDIHVGAVVHEGETVAIACQADDYTIFRDYLIALEESGRFTTPVIPPEGYPYVKGGTITLEPKYQYIDMPAVHYEANQAPTPMTDRAAIAILVSIAEKSGIDIDPNAGKFVIPSAWLSEEKVGGGTYQVLSFRNIRLQGDYGSVMAFLSDLDSCTTLKTLILTRVSISQTEVHGKIETTATLDVDIYSVES